MCENISVYSDSLYQDLAAGVKKALSGELEVLLLELLMPPPQYEAYRLQQAMAVSGCLYAHSGGAWIMYFHVCMHESFVGRS